MSRSLTSLLQPRLTLRPARLTTTTYRPLRSIKTMSHIPQLDGLKIEEQVHKADATQRTQRGMLPPLMCPLEL